MLKRYYHILLLVVICGIKTFGQETVWEVTGYLPHGICAAEAVVIDSTIYIMGGYNDSVQTITNWIYSFNPTTNEVTYLNKMKKKRGRFIAAASDSLIYIAGGEAWSMQKLSGLLECYNPFTNKVTTIDSNPRFNRTDAAAIIRNNSLYVAGGSPQGPPSPSNPYFFEYSIPQKSISYNANYFGSGFPREQVVSFVNNEIYLMGGSFHTVSRDVFRYNVNTRYFKKQMPGLLNVRAGGRAVYFTRDSSQVMLLGGHNERNHALSSVEVYNFSDTSQISYIVMSPLLYKRKEFMAVNLGNYIYVFGGKDESGNLVYAVERYQIVTGVNDNKNEFPDNFTLAQNYPNPFNSSTVITYSLPQRSNVLIKVYDLLGRLVTELINKEEEAGNHSLTFNGNSLPGGVYFYRINVNNFTSTKKMILLK